LKVVLSSWPPFNEPWHDPIQDVTPSINLTKKISRVKYDTNRKNTDLGHPYTLFAPIYAPHNPIRHSLPFESNFLQIDLHYLSIVYCACAEVAPNGTRQEQCESNRRMLDCEGLVEEQRSRLCRGIERPSQSWDQRKPQY
jgi:hypothetical protein